MREFLFECASNEQFEQIAGEGGTVTETRGWPAAVDDAPIRVLISTDEPLFSQAVKLALDRENDLEVVAEPRNRREVAAAVQEAQPDVALLADDGAGDPARMIQSLRERAPRCRTLLLGINGDEKALIAALENGASGFLTRDESLSELVGALRAAHRGDTYVPQRMLGALVSELVRRGTERSDALVRMARLTRREREVLALLAGGSDTTEIARELVISRETARTHLQHILCKLGVHSRLQAAKLIIENNILDKLVEDEFR